MTRRKQAPQQLTAFSGVSAVYLVLLLTFFLFYVGGDGYLSILKHKYDVFNWISAAYIVVMLLLPLEYLLISEKKTFRLRDVVSNNSWSQRLIAAYLLLTIVSALLSPHQDLVWFGGDRHEGAVTIGLSCLCFLLLSKTARPARWLIDLCAVAVLLESVLCILQLSGRNPFALYPHGLTYYDADVKYSGAFLSTIGNVDFLGAFFCITIPILWSSLFVLKDRRRWLYVPVVMTALYVVVKMEVMLCWLGLALGAVVTLFLLADGSRTLRWALFAGLCLLGASALVLIWFVDLPMKLPHEIHLLLHGSADFSLDSGRLRIWRDVLARVPEHFWFGTGPDTMRCSDIAPFTHFDEALQIQRVGKIDAAHNEYLNILYHQGIFALLAYVGALASALATGLKQCGKDPRLKLLIPAFSAYLIQAVFNISMFVSAPFFWAVFAMICGLINEKTKFNERGERKQS